MAWLIFKDSPTLLFLKRICRELGIHICTTIAEKDASGDIYNTCVIVGANGELCGTIRKSVPASFEAFLFKTPELTSHVIATNLGRIGVGICYENSLCFLTHQLEQDGAQILLMPHACPMGTPSIVFPEFACLSIVNQLRGIAGDYARRLHLPVVMCNQSGAWDTPMLDVPGLAQRGRFPGLSTIVASDGTTVARLDAEENECIYGRVRLRSLPHISDPAVLEAVGPLSFSYVPWCPLPPWVRVLFSCVERFGAFVYWAYPRKWRAALARGT